MSGRFILVVSGAFLLVFAIGVAAVVGITSLADRTPSVDVSLSAPADDNRVPVAVTSFAPFSPQVQPPVTRTAHAPEAPPVAGRTVADSDILDLATAIKLGQVAPTEIGRDVWAHELPVAQGLLSDMCDCDQRNWLKHFVQAGQEALAGSSNYPESVQLLTRLHRSDLDHLPPAR